MVTLDCVVLTRRRAFARASRIVSPNWNMGNVLDWLPMTCRTLQNAAGRLAKTRISTNYVSRLDYDLKIGLHPFDPKLWVVLAFMWHPNLPLNLPFCRKVGSPEPSFSESTSTTRDTTRRLQIGWLFRVDGNLRYSRSRSIHNWVPVTRDSPDTWR